MRRPEDYESSHLGDGRCKERETQQTERREYEQRAERCRILRPNVSLTTYMTTHAHKRPMRMRNMPEVAAPELRQKSYTEISEKTLEIPRGFKSRIYAFSGSGGPLGRNGCSVRTIATHDIVLRHR